MKRRGTPRAGLLVACVLLCSRIGCEQQPAAPQTQPAPQPASPTRVDAPPDRVRHPSIDPAERIADPALRIVSLAPNVTEIACALGLREQLVGRTRFCTYPPEIDAVQELGGLPDLNVEALVALRPTLVLLAGASRAQTDRLTGLNLTVVSTPDETLEDLYNAIRIVGRHTGRAATADALCAAIRSDFALIAAGAELPRRRCLLIPSVLSEPPTPPYAAGRDTFYDDLLRTAGQVNVIDSTGYGAVSFEYILRADPDWIFEIDPREPPEAQTVEGSRAAWSVIGSLQAVQDDRVRVLTGGRHFLLGPRLPGTFYDLCNELRRVSRP